nr:hypothetical protein Hi04_10k_c4921_00015 [uncultured bacterium]
MATELRAKACAICSCFTSLSPLAPRKTEATISANCRRSSRILATRSCSDLLTQRLRAAARLPPLLGFVKAPADLPRDVEMGAPCRRPPRAFFFATWTNRARIYRGAQFLPHSYVAMRKVALKRQ